ncbi:50S ribosomal protein L9 [Candidatus Beckwithbacteria bacterium CG23_combo_of_CG06-09_8_20_14_all_34_8]|uniref:50S ribosomal protein L9 n=1 Tax=Candidatus Beckwithbacteria bacterium CG23_combo_of_CG06-09_8_20_14_all_34_8 TaxID=1974497 RepID=A0A2H0B689_9BACT|nr:MAG: 50S ribosomal protein L9 [Candidatus Beckwithbacteria bacterium CG23_combo_of_CG06-09_8_20_14_all_34_8]
MKILILKTNQIQDVKDSYAVNFLIPKGLAILATKQVQKDLVNKKVQKQQQIQKRKQILSELVQKIENKTFTIKAKANSDGQLYACVGEKQIKKLLKIKEPLKIINKSEIKQLGLYKLEIKIGINKFPIKLRITN